MIPLRRQSQIPPTGDIYIFGAGGVGRDLVASLSAAIQSRVKGFLSTAGPAEVMNLPVLTVAQFMCQRRESDIIILANGFVAETRAVLRMRGTDADFDALGYREGLRRRRLRTVASLLLLGVGSGLLLLLAS
jgi:hypothetical protein